MNINFGSKFFIRWLLWAFLLHFLIIFYVVFSLQTFQSNIVLYIKFSCLVVEGVLTFWPFFLWWKLNCLLVLMIVFLGWFHGSFSGWILVCFMGLFFSNGINRGRLLIPVWNGYWVVSGSLLFILIESFVFRFVGSGLFGWFLL